MKSPDDNHASEYDNKENVPIVKGEYHYRRGDVYKGELINGAPSGRGKLIYREGHTYEGEFKNGKPHGHGKLSDSGGFIIHYGQYKKGIQHGIGVFINR